MSTERGSLGWLGTRPTQGPSQPASGLEDHKEAARMSLPTAAPVSAASRAAIPVETSGRMRTRSDRALDADRAHPPSSADDPAWMGSSPDHFPVGELLHPDSSWNGNLKGKGKVWRYTVSDTGPRGESPIAGWTSRRRQRTPIGQMCRDNLSLGRHEGQAGADRSAQRVLRTV